jgi:hypothetical protein
VTCKSSGPTSQMEMEKVPQVHVTRKPLGPKGRMVPQVHVTRKPSGPTGRMEIENGSIGIRDM